MAEVQACKERTSEREKWFEAQLLEKASVINQLTESLNKSQKQCQLFLENGGWWCSLVIVFTNRQERETLWSKSGSMLIMVQCFKQLPFFWTMRNQRVLLSRKIVCTRTPISTSDPCSTLHDLFPSFFFVFFSVLLYCKLVVALALSWQWSKPSFVHGYKFYAAYEVVPINTPRCSI